MAPPGSSLVPHCCWRAPSAERGGHFNSCREEENDVHRLLVTPGPLITLLPKGWTSIVAWAGSALGCAPHHVGMSMQPLNPSLRGRCGCGIPNGSDVDFLSARASAEMVICSPFGVERSSFPLFALHLPNGTGGMLVCHSDTAPRREQNVAGVLVE